MVNKYNTHRTLCRCDKQIGAKTTDLREKTIVDQRADTLAKFIVGRNFGDVPSPNPSLQFPLDYSVFGAIQPTLRPYASYGLAQPREAVDFAFFGVRGNLGFGSSGALNADYSATLKTRKPMSSLR